MSKLQALTDDIIQGSEKLEPHGLRFVTLDLADAARIARHLLDQGWRKVEYPAHRHQPPCSWPAGHSGPCNDGREEMGS